MITKFKIFENLDEDKELIDYLDEDTIEKYFDDNYDIDIIELVDMCPSCLWNAVDDEKFIEDYKQDEIGNRSFYDYSKTKFKEYLESNWNDEIEDKIVEIWKENNYIDEEEETEYEENMYKQLSEDELKDVIEYCFSESDFVEEMVEDSCRNYYDAQSLIEDMYGPLEGEDLYRTIQWYIDDDDAKKEYKDNEDWYYKKEFVEGSISRDRSLQKEIFEEDENSVIQLANLFADENSSNNIGDDYWFQKTYIEKCKEKNPEDEDEHMIVPTAIKFLHDNFGLHPDIEDEHKDDTFLIGTEKYNL